MRRAFIALALAASLSYASSANAWAPIYSTRPVWNLPVPYSLNSAGSVDLGGFAATQPEVMRAMGDWTLVSCTDLTNRYNGSTSAVPGTYEGTSVIGWIESSWPHSTSAIGVTGPRWGSYIVEADMELNGVNFTWTTGPGSFNDVNTYSIVLHEGGHYYGLGHTTVSGSAMWPSYSGGVVGLGPDDQMGICALYPGSGTSDCTTTGCPSGQECVSGACMAVTGDGSVCSPCTSSAQCGGASDLCLGYPDGAGYCGRACSSNADCGSDVCASTSAGGQCVRLVGGTPSCSGGSSGGCTNDTDCASDQLCSSGACVARPTTGNDLGAGCSNDGMCRSALCLAGVCTQTCDWLSTGSCPSGFYCESDPASCSSGYCLRGTAGAGQLGDACSGDTECASLYCDAGACSQPCIPGGAVACPSGYTCQVGTLPCRGSCRRARPLGDRCEGNDDCSSAMCAQRGDETFCTQLCDAGAPCPDGFSCMAAGAQSVCVPDLGGVDAACTTDTDCLSGVCTTEHGGSYCTRSCASPADCPEGFSCAMTDTDASVCVRDERGLGQSCEANGDCASGACAQVGSDTFCTEVCSDADPCPSGFECASAGTTDVCRPIAMAASPGCGCRVSAPLGVPAMAPWLLALGLLYRRRRR